MPFGNDMTWLSFFFPAVFPLSVVLWMVHMRRMEKCSKEGGTGEGRTGVCSAVAELCNCFAIICLPGGDTDRWVIVEDGDELEKKAEDDDEEQDEVEVLGETVEGFAIDGATVADSFAAVAAAVVLIVESIGLSEVFAEVEDKVKEGVMAATMELFLSLLLLGLLLLLERVK